MKVVLGVCCALIGQSHSSGGTIGSKIERAVNPVHPIFTCPGHSSDMSHVTIDPCTGQSAGSVRANRTYCVAAPLAAAIGVVIYRCHGPVVPGAQE